MDEQHLIELGNRLEEAFNAGDWDAYAAPLTDDTLYASPRLNARGRAEIIQFVRGVRETFPDMRATATNILVCGNTLVREITWEGTHGGPLKTPQGTVPPTNRPIKFSGVILLEASNAGEVLAVREYYDRAAVMAQMGIGAPAPASTT